MYNGNLNINENTVFIVTDLECNFSKDEKVIPKHEREIIEIGAVAVDGNYKVLDEISIFVKPVKHPTLTQDCIDFCHIKQSDVDNAPTLEKAIYQFEDWFLKFSNRVFASWGNFDKVKFDKDCQQIGIQTPFENHINVKELFAKTQGLRRGVGIERALKACGIRFAGTAHRGVDDSRNIARLLTYSVGDSEARYKHTLNKRPFNNNKGSNHSNNSKNVSYRKKREYKKD